jgi:hypothetical protein
MATETSAKSNSPFDNPIDTNIEVVQEQCKKCFRAYDSEVCKKRIQLKNPFNQTGGTFEISCAEAVKAFQIPEELLPESEKETF